MTSTEFMTLKVSDLGNLIRCLEDFKTVDPGISVVEIRDDIYILKSVYTTVTLSKSFVNERWKAS